MYKKIIDHLEACAGSSAIFSEANLTKTIAGITFIQPTQQSIQKTKISGYSFEFNNEGALYYNGGITTGYANKIAELLKLDPRKVVMPNKAQAMAMLADEQFRTALQEKEIYWIPFIIDKKNPARNVSLTEFWEDQEKYLFRHVSLLDSVESYEFPFNPNNKYMGVILGIPNRDQQEVQG